MPRRGTERRRKEAAITTRFDRDLYDRVHHRADAAGLCDAAFLRGIAAEAVGADPIQADPSPPRRPIQSAPPEDVAALSGLVTALGKITGPLVQAAIWQRREGRDLDHQALESLISQIRGIAADAAAAVRRIDPR